MRNPMFVFMFIVLFIMLVSGCASASRNTTYASPGPDWMGHQSPHSIPATGPDDL